MARLYRRACRAVSTGVVAMSAINWLEKLGWTEEQVEDLRYTGFAYIRQGKYDIALPFFEALTTLDPKSGYDAQTLGAIYLQLNHPEKAIKCLERVLQFDIAEKGPILLNLAKSYLSLGRKEEGLRIAKELKGDSNTAVSNMAKALILAYGK